LDPSEARGLLPVKVLSRVFRGKFVEALRRAYAQNELDLAGGSEHLRDPAAWRVFVNALFDTDWVVYAKPAFGGATAVLRYLGRYTHRVAISNYRLLAFDGNHVTFSYKDYAQGGQRRTMTLTAMEFLRRFVQHILPRRFVRIRQSGFLANTCRVPRLTLTRTLLALPIGGGNIYARDHDGDHRDGNARDVGVSPMRRRDDRRAHPLGTPPGHHHAPRRHLMSAICPRHDRRPRRRGRSRSEDRVSRVVPRGADRARRHPAEPTSPIGRRCSRSAVSSMSPRTRLEILIPAP
jgi:Putative transposase